MRKIVLLCGVILALSLPAMAQDNSRIEAYGGYSYVRFNFANIDIHSNLNGGAGGVAFYPGKWLGIVGEIGGYKISSITGSGVSTVTGTPATSLDVSGSVISYLFGPRIRFGSGGVHPFAQVLFGGVHASDITCSTSTTGCSSGVFTKSDNAFALTTGGGIDIPVGRHFAIRGQGEYLMTRFKDPTSSSGARTGQNNARIFAGIVIH